MENKLPVPKYYKENRDKKLVILINRKYDSILVLLNGFAESMRYHRIQILEFQMRYHIFKDSVQRNLLIADSQAKYLDFANFNILSLPGAKVHDVYNFIPRVGRFDIIVFSSEETIFSKVNHPLKLVRKRLRTKLVTLLTF